MSNSYNKHYKKKEYFGKSYPGLVNFFETYPERNSVLDLGCGQGRDSLLLGRLGYRVCGVDISDVGIKQMNEIAKNEHLLVEGVIADIYAFPISDKFDMVLFDSIFHFYKKDFEKEKKLLVRVAEELKSGGVLCNFMLKGEKREVEIKKIIQETGIHFEVLCDDYTIYPEYNCEYHMFILKKQNEKKEK